MESDPTFAIHGELSRANTLVCGLAEYGLAGLTAANYLVEHLDLDPVGHIGVVEGLPAITPFENGTPRRHTRLFSREDLSVTVLVGEMLLPGYAAAAFGAETVSCGERIDAEEVVVLSGVPVAHGPDDHRPFYIASEGYQERHDLTAADVKPMAGGFLDGINAAVTTAGMDAPLDTCIYTTPAHPQAPDAEAALRLLSAFDAVHEVNIDTEPLQTFADEVSRYYAELADRMHAAEPADRTPEDRMYM